MRIPFSQRLGRARGLEPRRPGVRGGRGLRGAMLWAATSWLAGFAAAGGAAASEPEGAIDVRALPTLVVHWERSETRVEDVVVDDGVAYARARRAIEAIELASGRTLWKVSLDQRIAAGPVLLDERLAVIVDASALTLIDRSSGVVTAERRLPGVPYREWALAGPPLVAAIQREDGYGNELLRLDDVNGHELDRLSIDRLASLRSVRGTTVASFESGGRSRLIGIRGEDLSPAWDLPILAWRLYENGDHFVAGAQVPANAFLFIDPRDGTLESPERPWPSTEEGAWRPAWDLEVVGRRPPVTLRRLDPDSGRPLWEISLPCSPSAWTRDDDRLLLDCRAADRGRSLLLVIDLAAGAILRRAPGFHVVSTLEIVDDLGLAASHDGLAAFSLTAEGPAIADTRSVGQEVDTLLTAAREGRASADEVAADLSRIGDPALPLLTRKLPVLDDRAAQAAASVLGHAAYAPAANVVAERLRSLPVLDRSEGCEEHQALPYLNLKLALITALGRLGGDGAEELLGAILTHPRETPLMRQRASFALAELGTADAAARLESLRRKSQRKRWWNPQEPSAGLDRTAQTSGGHDKGFTSRPRDRDEDGLNDRLEERFGTDATLADTDDDGIPDTEDLVPQAPPAMSLDDEEEIALTVMDSFFRYQDRWRDGMAFIEAERPLPWTGRTGPTFTVPPERVDELRGQLGYWQSPIFGVRRAGPDEVDEEHLEYLDLKDGDHLYIVTAPQEEHFAIVRRVGDRWVVREIRLWWIA